ncbi:NADH:flavin oxidoreductase/NADH oxidase [Cylindrobasidium torrendii FP15055 ss-10]|uniref:NADH:flavin oxidoreductase/NADH oxidase n=1 Tax=Cylindrobasidium torrendii FP15055 ss-10 TaxID=1314674 RepID=A0A0D7BNX1_9AGAR|nr:NADH:flavin oxidoreductase/NADH oxidase [Cylindrobasidium torrendii FP15055 ss-10]
MPELFEPIQVGRLQLAHRVVMPPMARMRIEDGAPINPWASTYYSQRASVPGTLLIAEATIIAPQAGMIDNISGIWSDKQIAAWKEVVDAVHAKGSYICMQIAATGRVANLDYLKSLDPKFKVVGPSAIPYEPGAPIPHALTVEEIEEYVEWFGKAAENAVLKAGFDGVEIHGANGYLVEQFLSHNANQRTDQYGGSPERRVKFAVDIVERVARSIGEDRVSIRVSPWSIRYGLGMPDPKPTYTHLASELKRRFPNMAWMHAIESRVDEEFRDIDVQPGKSNDFLVEAWAPKPFIRAGGFDGPLALEAADRWDNVLVSMGRWFISNPDLPTRLKEGYPLTKYIRPTFYLPGDTTGIGYTDYTYFSNKAQIVVASS